MNKEGSDQSVLLNKALLSIRVAQLLIDNKNCLNYCSKIDAFLAQFVLLIFLLKISSSVQFNVIFSSLYNKDWQ